MTASTELWVLQVGLVEMASTAGTALTGLAALLDQQAPQGETDRLSSSHYQSGTLRYS